jgi:hypothetical protein
MEPKTGMLIQNWTTVEGISIRQLISQIQYKHKQSLTFIIDRTDFGLKLKALETDFELQLSMKETSKFKQLIVRGDGIILENSEV